jgi:hypothetical protein
MLDPFNNSSSDYFGQSRFSDGNAQNADMAAQLVGGVIQNRGYITAAKRADEYRRRAMEAGQPSTGSQVGGALAGAGTGALSGFAAGGPIGAVVGGVSGLLSRIF